MSGAPLRVGVMGAGAVGAYVGGWLATAPEVEVLLVGRQRLADAVAAEGLVVSQGAREERVRQVQVATAAAALAESDVVLCCVKSRDTEAVAKELTEILRPEALVVSLQNGVRNPATLRAALGAERVLAGVVGFNAVLRSAHEARQTTDGDLELEQREHESARRLYAALRAGGLSLTTHRDLAPRQWSKLLINLSNAVSALSGAPTKELLVQAGYRRILAAVLREGIGVARAAGQPLARLRGLPVGAVPMLLRAPSWIVRLALGLKVDPKARSSMAQDLERGRPTEVAYLNGEIVRLAAEHGATAPLNQRLVELIRAAEAAGGSPSLGPEAFWTALHEREDP
ncbi:MAG TPA: 2-dehydropantoate 2-reductase [Planctomycetes bacterium]|nr:2-dehydropantoate 2-reductase [Planctomycetota bacterium]